MEDSREIQFREIQKIVDACIQHDYKTMVDAFSLKKEYLNESQLKDYLRGCCEITADLLRFAFYPYGYGAS